MTNVRLCTRNYSLRTRLAVAQMTRTLSRSLAQGGGQFLSGANDNFALMLVELAHMILDRLFALANGHV